MKILMLGKVHKQLDIKFMMLIKETDIKFEPLQSIQEMELKISFNPT